MLELPEVITMSKQLNAEVTGKKIDRVLPPSKPHKFCWYNGDPAEYNTLMAGQTITAAEGFGIYVELCFAAGGRLCINDGVNVRLIEADELPKNYQLAVCFTDGTALAFTVAMYGGIILHGSDYDDKYYIKSREYVSPFSEGFEEHYRRILSESKKTLSAKAFLATEQRFPGIGNGVSQDILFAAGIHPKRKVSAFDEEESATLLESIRSVLAEMTEKGGRDTERDLFGAQGGYITKMSKNSLASGCPRCMGPITKEAYLGGSVYYCPNCQKL